MSLCQENLVLNVTRVFIIFEWDFFDFFSVLVEIKKRKNKKNIKQKHSELGSLWN